MNTEELRYTTTADDFLFLIGRYASASEVARRFVGFAFVAIPVLAWVSAGLFYWKQHQHNSYWIAYAALAAFLTVATPWLYRLYQDSFWKSVLTAPLLKGLIGPTTVRLTDAGIEEVTAHATRHARWEEVERLEVAGGYVLIYLAPLLAVAVPPRAFASPADRDTFASRVTARLGPRP